MKPRQLRVRALDAEPYPITCWHDLLDACREEALSEIVEQPADYIDLDSREGDEPVGDDEDQQREFYAIRQDEAVETLAQAMCDALWHGEVDENDETHWQMRTKLPDGTTLGSGTRYTLEWGYD